MKETVPEDEDVPKIPVPSLITCPEAFMTKEVCEVGGGAGAVQEA